MNRKKNIYEKNWIDVFIAFMLTFTVMLILYIAYGYAPFGDKSLACMDANIQYLDFFAYFKDVLTGKNSIGQTFSKFLGGSNIGTYSYYLASPFNIFVLFFKKSNLHDFFDWVVALKVAVSSATFCVFLHKRFEDCWKIWHKRELAVLLSVSYGLCQYDIAQSSNIMWLDGVYMLPLILWGVYDVVFHHSGWKLSLFVGISILFGWYSAGIDCLFSGIWFCFELLLKLSEQDRRRVREKLIDTTKCFGQYVFFMIVGVLNSAILFWPTVKMIRGSSKGGLALSNLADLSLIGRISTVIEGYALGARSSLGVVSLFCGSLALIGCLSCFISKNISIKKKIIFGIMIGLALMTFYWNPLYILFSLLKTVESYWYRHSYVGIFTILFLAAYFYSQQDLERDALCIWRSSAVTVGVLLFWNYLGKSQNTRWSYYTAAFFVLTGAFLTLCMHRLKKWKRNKAIWGIIGVLVIGELAYGSKLQMDNYHTSDVAEYKKYVEDTERQIRYIKNMDDSGMYRVSQTSTRNYDKNKNLTANYNEAMAFGYASLTSYTSSPDDRQMAFLARMGYRYEGECMTVVNTSIVGADSLLGIKYVLSDYPVNGLREVAETEVNGKKIYSNPYYIPLALTYEPHKYYARAYDLFEYQNMIYGQLLGEQVEVYKPLNFSVERDDDGAQKYLIQIPSGNYALYGDIPWDWWGNTDVVVNVNDAYEMAYASWLSQDIFYIPTEMNSKATIATVKLITSDYDGVGWGQERFYGLDLDALQNVSESFLYNIKCKRS